MKKVAVIWESGEERRVVGWLTRPGGEWAFRYANGWKIQIDPELPLKGGTWLKSLPSFFAERLPPVLSGQFAHYAKEWGIKGKELRDDMAFLVTIGHRGPDNYVFEPVGFCPARWAELKD